MSSRTGRLSQDRNLGVFIKGKASFRGQKKTGRADVMKPNGEATFRAQKKTGKAAVRKPIGEASFGGQKKTGGCGVRKLFGDSPNSGEPNIINQPGGKKAQDGPLISGKQLKSEKLASVKEAAVPSKDKNLDSKRTASEVPEKSLTRMLQGLSDIANSGKLETVGGRIIWDESESALLEEFCSEHSYEKCREQREPLPREKCLWEIFEIQKDGYIGSETTTLHNLMPKKDPPAKWVVKELPDSDSDSDW